MSLRTVSLALALLIAGAGRAQPPGPKVVRKRPQIVKNPLQQVIVSVAVFQLTGAAPAWLVPSRENASVAGKRRLQELWGTPLEMLARLRKEIPAGKVSLKFFGALSSLAGEEASMESGKEVQVGDKRRTVGTSLETATEAGPAGRLGLKLNIRLEEIGGFFHPDDGPPVPMITSREVSDALVLPDGEVVLLGGMTHARGADDEAKPLVHTVMLVRADLIPEPNKR